MTKSVAGLACLIFVASVAGIVSDTGAAADRTRNSEGGLIALASAKFPNLTRAERALLAYETSQISRPACLPWPGRVQIHSIRQMIQQMPRCGRATATFVQL
jgi:hypothetical protein